MRFSKQRVIFSATDLVNFLGCCHATYLDVRDLKGPQGPAAADPFLQLLQEKGLAHERRYLEVLQAQGREVVNLAAEGSSFERVDRTREAMAAGVDVIYQGALSGDRWHGYADFLVRVSGPSSLGDFHYEAVDTKLSSIAKPKHALQLSVYSRLLAAAQGRLPRDMHIVVGSGKVVTLRTSDIHYYSEVAREGLEAFADALPTKSAGEPCNHCGNCRWSDGCVAEWDRWDHLSLVAGITKGQRANLVEAGVPTMAALATTSVGRVPGIQPEVLSRLQSQATLQVAKRADGRDRYEVLPASPGKGFARLPKPDPGDLFFDMEGNPLFDGGLEYLFGFVTVTDGTPTFTPFWGHSRAEEKTAFEQVMEFIARQLELYPNAHVYHYASYEESALKRLAMLHGTRESAVDDLLRAGKLVDLYQVVRESIRVSEPSYSIKNLERFYTEARTGDVKDAGASVVMYEEWRQLKDPQRLQDIADYNEFDCVSTWKLRDWLLSLRPDGVDWYAGGGNGEPVDPEREAKRRQAEQRCVDMQVRLLKAPAAEHPFRELIGQLLEFHRREAKPVWWAMFQRQDMSENELIDDGECIGGLRADPGTPPYKEKRSMVYTFTFPAQDFKMRVGDRPKMAATLEDAGEVVLIDEAAGQIRLKIGPKAAPFEAAFSLIPSGPIGTEVIRDAIYRFAESVAGGGTDYSAVRSILMRDHPRVQGIQPAQPILPGGNDIVAEASSAIGRLDESHILVQGPPGTGKTYLSAHAIVDLLAQGKRIGVASNSHKAINNLLEEIEEQAKARNVTFRGAKKSSADDHEHAGSQIVNLNDSTAISDGHFDLIAGTAWLFAREEFDQTLDYLFIDEAGQVALANVVAMGLSARNIVLVGDQMQLSQPAQGVHPGDSGKSALERLLGEAATVPPERGIFLPVTRRMHPDVCRFISEAVYDGRLNADPANAVQKLILTAGIDPGLKASGISWVPVINEGCSQRSEAEGVRIRCLYEELLEQSWVNKKGVEAPIRPTDILVVSPYNMQVNHLRSVLPAGARVGTVDKFQGQEAAVVLVSMTSSSAEDVSRGLEFLYSRNRLNVAVSRAKCLAVVVANPTLLEARCTTIEQMRLVNMLCSLAAYAAFRI
jgi:uncharacterized protein